MSRRLRDPNALKTPTMEDLRQLLIDAFSFSKPFQTFESTDYTTTGQAAHEYVFTTGTGTGTQTVSLHASPREGDRVTVKRGTSKAVTVDTDGSETIDGSASVSLASQYDTQTYLAMETTSNTVNYVIIGEMVN